VRGCCFAEPDAEAECALCVDADAIVEAWWWDDAALVTVCVVVFVTVFVLVAAFELVGFGSASPSASPCATCAPVSTDESAPGLRVCLGIAVTGPALG
jgi:hypothetical protein